jgi:ribonuclease VapC
MRGRLPNEDALDEFLSRYGIQIEALTPEQAKLATAAFTKHGKGRHPASLNYGDCFTYALAKATREPLLFKGNDFSKTDLPPAVKSPQ